ncbi:MAG: GGDEF domain-containing protein [Lachnospiraceae bacterium]|nr:GGDEF domain-containing protein [Lachnospiraceae bacterium]
MAFSEDLLNVELSLGDMFIMICDSEHGNRIVCNRSKLDVDEKALENKPFSDNLDLFVDIVMEEDLETLSVFAKKIYNGTRVSDAFVEINDNRVAVSVRMRRKDKIYSYHNMTCYMTKDEDGYIERVTCAINEMTAEELYRFQLSQTITNDRHPAMFMKVAKEIIRKNPEGKYALIQFDVAKFKAINEMYGEAVGDELLNFFIESLKVLCTSEQMFARLTADVFMVMTAYETKQDLLDFVEFIRTNLLGYKNMEYRLVFGIAFVKDKNENLRKYGDRASLARQSIKANAMEYVIFHDEKMTQKVVSAKRVEDDMEKALENHEFVMYLQPKFDMGTEKIVGAEALVRWIKPDKGVIPPMEFIPVFEKNGFVTRLDMYICEEACKVIRYWLDNGIEPVPISVNMSRANMKNDEYLKRLETLVYGYDIPKELLEIEITETVEGEDVAETIIGLKKHGYKLLMDDFGSGYSSLNTLKDTQFDIIKIDREFLQDFVGSDRGKVIVEHTIQMTKSIGLDIVAEGVENLEQARFLVESGCRVAQGFYYAKPMPVEEFDKLYEEKNKTF